MRLLCLVLLSLNIGSCLIFSIVSLKNSVIDRWCQQDSNAESNSLKSAPHKRIPVSRHPAPPSFFEVFVCYVEAAEVGDTIINKYDFSMVSPTYHQ